MALFLWEVGLSSVSIREAVLLEGVLKGMSLEVACMVRAVKVSLPKLEIWEYVRADIVQAPSELPFGAYDVSFEGRTMKVKKTAGGWIAGQV
jgi:hypothetical protein